MTRGWGNDWKGSESKSGEDGLPPSREQEGRATTRDCPYGEDVGMGDFTPSQSSPIEGEEGRGKREEGRFPH